MPKFVLLDHSLKKVGGHQCEYALNVLQVAEAAGYEPVIATNKKFKNDGIFPSRWPICNFLVEAP